MTPIAKSTNAELAPTNCRLRVSARVSIGKRP